MSDNENRSRKKRGRPTGYKLSESSKRQISCSKTGQKHKPETRDKISRSLKIYFKHKNPLSEELMEKYCNMTNDDVYYWITEVQDKIDSLDDVKTERILHNDRKVELSFGQNIEYFGHNLTPEMVVLFNEYCRENGLEYDDIVDE